MSIHTIAALKAAREILAAQGHDFLARQIEMAQQMLIRRKNLREEAKALAFDKAVSKVLHDFSGVSTSYGFATIEIPTCKIKLPVLSKDDAMDALIDFILNEL